LRLVVRTQDFHSCNRGSNPLGVTKKPRTISLCAAFLLACVNFASLNRQNATGKINDHKAIMKQHCSNSGFLIIGQNDTDFSLFAKANDFGERQYFID
ncbi:MAG: hypothetical protein ACE5I1_15815, partial [bacterium]